MGKCGVCLVMVLLALSGCGDDADATTPTSGAGGGGGGAGAGMSGGMAGGGPPPVGTKAGCSVAVAGAPAALHQAAVDAITATMGAQASCAASTSCHKNAKAMLMLAGVTDLKTAMVGKASCEAPNVPLVDPRGGDAALANSFLWIKLVAPDTGAGIALNPAWGTPGACGVVSGPGTAGQRMPMGLANDAYVGDAQLAAIRNWICAGAPGP